MSATSARRSRAQHKVWVEKRIGVLTEKVDEVAGIDTGQVTSDHTSGLQLALQKAQESLEKYTEAINLCFDIEEKEPGPDDEDMVSREEFENEIDELEFKVHAWKTRVKEEKASRARAEAAQQGGTHGQAGNVGRVTAKPPPLLDKDVSLDEYETWLNTWNDYYSVTKLEKEANPTQRANLKSYFSQEMRGIVEHVLSIGEDTTKSCEDILKDIKAYIRSNRNVQIDKVAFEKRSQKQGESFDDYLVAIRKLARNADLCKTCLDERLLTKIMSGVVDRDVREELLAKVPAPGLEEAIVFARSKEAAHRSNMDLTGRVSVQQIRGRDRLRSRSESPRGYHRRDQESPRGRFTGDQFRARPGQVTQKSVCYFCNRDDCFSRNDKERCPALGKNCHRCGLRDHFPGSLACKRGWSKRDILPNRSHSRNARAVQVRGLKSTERAPMAKINVRSLDGCEDIGSIMFYPDSAADCTIMGQHMMEQLGIHKGDLEPPDEEGVDAANKSPFRMIGRAKVTLEYYGRTVQDTIHVVEEETDFLVSWDSCIGLDILHKNYPNPISMETPSTRSISKSRENETLTSEDKTEGASVKRLLALVGNQDEPSESDRKMVKDMLMTEYKDVFSVEEELKPMNCTPMSIQLKPGFVPTRVCTPRKIGPALKPPTKKELDDMERKKTIVAVSADYATDWCHPFCPREKPSGGIRPTVDLKSLNEWVQRPAHPVTTPYEAVHSVTPGSRWYTVCDAKSGYHQIPLDEEAQDLTCFITPWGRYKFLRGPQGFVGTGDKYNYETDRAIAGVQDTTKVVDDIMTANITFQDHIERVIEVLERCRKAGITLSPNKFKFAEHEVKYVGYIVGRNGIKVDPAKLKAIQEYPKPTNISELRSFDGMVNQLGHFSTELTEARGVLKDLRSQKNIYSWNEDHDKAFEAVKECLTRLTILAHFDPKLPTRVDTDGSKLKGLGYSLQQEHGRNCKCKCPEICWMNVQCGSRHLSETESRYAPIEFEALGVAWAVRKCHYFLAGMPEFLIRNDHRTLIPILNNYSLNDIENPRVRRLVEKLRPYKYKAEHISGEKNKVADAFSRAPVDMPTEEDILGEDITPQIRRIVRRAASCAGVEDEVTEELLDPNMEMIKKAAGDDQAYQDLLLTVRNGFPEDKNKLKGTVRPYFELRKELSEWEGMVILRSHRIIIPMALRKEILKRLHASHQGIDRTQRRARETVYWPGITSDISNTVASCCPCAERLPSNQKETLRTDPRPKRAFEQAATDLFDYAGKAYIVYVDRYSGWPCVHMWSSAPTSAKVIIQLRKWFVDLGIPIRVRSDGGPQFDSAEYREFLESWGVNPPGLSSPTYAQSNAVAESAVKAMKALVAKSTVNGDITCDAFQRGLLEWRNTPKAHGKSPAELLFGCQLRSTVPSLERNLNPPWKAAIEKKIAELQAKSEEYYNIGAKDLKELSVGDEVRIQDRVSKRWIERGVVARKGRNRDYFIELPNGRMRWRNRRFIRPVQVPAGGEEDGVCISNEDNDFNIRRGTRERKRTVRFNV